jgi:arsenical pump membrane protein
LIQIDPYPFLVAQFFVANIWSMMLFIGNPTNVIVAEAYSIGFLEYALLFDILAH